MKLLIILILTFSAATLASFFTQMGMNDFYPVLIKPIATPPAMAFKIVWPFLYTCMSVGLFLLLRHPSNFPWKNFYALQLSLNVIWCLTFFTLNWILISVFILMGLIACIGWMLWNMKHRIAILLYIPYFSWLIFALYLNISIVVLNN